MPKFTIGIDIDTDQLTTCTDSRLALLWDVAQANPAPLDDADASETAEKIGAEIIRRWLNAAPHELYHHQGRHHYWHNLCRFARWDGSRWVPDEAKIIKASEGGEPDGDTD